MEGLKNYQRFCHEKSGLILAQQIEFALAHILLLHMINVAHEVFISVFDSSFSLVFILFLSFLFRGVQSWLVFCFALMGLPLYVACFHVLFLPS